jgi:hypothetical protein
MNKDNLNNEIGFLFEADAFLNLEMYLLVKTEESSELRRADLGDGGLSDEIKNGFLNYLKIKTIENEETLVKPLSDLDDSRKTIHHYDFDELPAGLEIINTPLVSEEIPFFNFEDDKLENIEAFLIKISTTEKHVILYKKHSHLNLLQQKSVFYFVKDNERFAKPKEGILKFSFSIDFLKVNGNIFVYDINCLEREFRFYNIVINTAKTKVNVIAGLNIIENIEELHDLVTKKSGAKKVLRLKPDSPVLSIEFDRIRTFVKNHPFLKRRLKFNEDESKFRFHSKISRIYLLDLLNDNYLNSDLTSIFYQTESKNEMSMEEGEDNEE